MASKSTKIGALVKYNPCSSYAQGGVQCQFYVPGIGRVCTKPPGKCELPKYDEWFKEVTAGRIKSFFPRRILLLEIPGTTLLVYHSHKRRITGEAKIAKSTVKCHDHYYWFDKFIAYPNPVDLRLVQTDSRFNALARGGSWGVVYVSCETLEEIRDLSELHGKSRERLRRETGLARADAEKLVLPRDVESYVRKKETELGSQVKPEVLRKAKEIFNVASRGALLKGRTWERVYDASLYLAFRVLKVPRSLHEIQRIAGIRRKGFAALAALIIDELSINIPPASPGLWLDHISEELALSEETKRAAMRLMKELESKGCLSGLSPLTVAATVIFLSSKETGQNLMQQAISRAAGVTPVTIRNTAKAWRKDLTG